MYVWLDVGPVPNQFLKEMSRMTAALESLTAAVTALEATAASVVTALAAHADNQPEITALATRITAVQSSLAAAIDATPAPVPGGGPV